MFSTIISIALIIIFVSAAVFGILVSVNKSKKGGCSGCPSCPMSAACGKKPKNTD